MLSILRDPAWQGIGVIVGFASAIIGYYLRRRSRVGFYLLYLCSGLIIFILGMMAETWLVNNQSARVIVFSLPNAKIESSKELQVVLTSIDLFFPNTIVAEGIYSEVPDTTNLWVYVLSTDKKYYLKSIRKRDDKTWLSNPVKIGDESRIGGTYEVGILLAPNDCAEMQNDIGLIALPTCAAKHSWVSVERR